MKLSDLQAMAAQGWHLFPIRAGAKAPALCKWSTEATAEPDQLARWYEQHPGCNWGVATGPSGLLVIDIDTKGESSGFVAMNELHQQHGPLPETLVVDTPSGGRHLYFRGKGPSTGPQSAHKLGEGIDTRGVGGMVLAPGSVIDGQPYKVAIPRPVAEAPAWVIEHLGRPRERIDAPPATDLDQPTAVARVRRWLEEDAEPAREGAGGDQRTYHVACHCRDHGLSEAMALDLMLGHWNERCEPPWDPEELERKVANAYQYATGRAAGIAPEAAFQPLAPREPREPEKPRIGGSTAADIDPMAIPPRAWIMDRRFIANYLTVTVAPGGVGKSTLALLEAMAVATGQPLTGAEVRRQGPVWYYNTEDPLDEIQRRTAAMAIHHGVPLRDLGDLHLTSGRAQPLILVSGEGQDLRVNTDEIQAVIDYIGAHGIKVFAVDPFVRCHSVNENDNGAIDLVVQALGQISEHTGCAVHVVHHTRKRGNTGGEGDMDTARGASSLVSAARFCHTLSGMSAEAAKELGLDESERPWYVRLDDAKANMVSPTAGCQWFRRRSYHLPNGDGVGVPELAELAAVDRSHEETELKAYVEAQALSLKLTEKNTVSLAAFARTIQDHPEAKVLLGKVRNASKHIRDLLPIPLDDGRRVQVIQGRSSAGRATFSVGIMGEAQANEDGGDDVDELFR